MVRKFCTSPNLAQPRPGEVAWPGRTSPPYYPLALARGKRGEVASGSPKTATSPDLERARFWIAECRRQLEAA